MIRAARSGVRAGVGIGIALMVLSTALGCYRPRLVDCVLACDGSKACPEGTSCSAGLCTRGPVCVTDVAAGGNHTCAVRAGTVACFGDNTYGQLGTRDRQSRGGAPDAPPASVDLAGRAAVAVAAGARHTCAIASDGGPAVALCWGDNSVGQLGGQFDVPGAATGGTGPDDAVVPGPVPLAAGRAVTALAAGVGHTCALLDDGAVACWGDNRFGQLGVAPTPLRSEGSTLGNANPDFTPVPLGGPAHAIAAGAYHTCAVMTSGGLRCWGWNEYGQLGGRAGGDGSPGAIVNVPLHVPLDVPLGATATAVAAGAFHSCARLDSGAVVCWGLDDAGQVGPLPGRSGVSQPPGPPVDLGAGRTARALTAGTSHTCALLDDFTVKCWGFNLEGQLGLGHAQNLGDDEPLGESLPRVALGGGPVSRLTAGANHTCAIQTAGVKCWGFGAGGRLGTGDPANRGADAAAQIVFARF